MTIAMPDSIYPDNLPPGYSAYLGYTDGDWPTAPVLREKFPGAHILALTVNGSTAADGSDCETGDLTAAQAAGYSKQRLAAGAWRPVTYASISRMPQVLDELGQLGIPRARVRLLSAHYDAGQHICGPDTCKYPGITTAMDGTQWTDVFTGVGARAIDMSVLDDSFFAGTTPPSAANWEDSLLATIATIKKGSTGQVVRNWQGLLVAHGYNLGGHLVSGVDGDFGAITDQVTRSFQSSARLTADGIVGQHTWTAALSA